MDNIFGVIVLVRAMIQLQMVTKLREAIPRKNQLTFGFFPNGLPPPVFLERFEELFKNIKVPHSVLTLVIRQHFPWKMHKSKLKKVPHHLWN